MKKLKYIILALVLISCRTGLDLVEDSYYYHVDKTTKHKAKIPLKTYGLNGFDTYVFNICEKLKPKKIEQRFCECPEDFYDINLEKDLQKVEELYLLKHKKTDIVIYLTTRSHKYIRKDGGFLNDRRYYENNIVLDQIEMVYVGRFDDISNVIHFPSFDDKKDIILHFEPLVFPKELLFINANIATAENDYSIVEPISLIDLFNQPFSYKKRDYSFSYYHGNNDMSSVKPKKVDSVKLFAKNGKIEFAFSFENLDKDYKMSQKRIKYLPNFYLIQEN